ncbi:CARDB domain-containing protein [Micromonospora siamensis]|uniref:CARDB domain-containing protein n=1 Tax=Micromonospora siamensis TaxID=299152 RepID=UPI0012FD6C75|nr:CARDB domain-containing protein [Micromonospora siamensis]
MTPPAGEPAAAATRTWTGLVDCFGNVKSTGLTVNKGESVQVTATGLCYFYPGRPSNHTPGEGLHSRIDEQDFTYGAPTTGTAPITGVLGFYFGDSLYTDNSGYGYTVTVTITSATPSPTPSPTGPADLVVMFDVLSPTVVQKTVVNGSAYSVRAWVKNQSTVAAQSVRVPFTLNGLTIASATPSVGSWSSSTSTWSVGTLAAGQERQITMSVKTPTGTATSILKTLQVNTSSANADPNTNNNKASVQLVSQSPSSKSAACTNGTTQTRTVTSVVNANGLRADGLWRVFRVPVVSATMVWTGVCMDGSGNLNGNGSYSVTARGLNGWTLSTVGAAQCSGDKNARHCNRYVTLQAPPGLTFNDLTAVGSIGLNLNAGVTGAAETASVTLNPNVSLTATWATQSRSFKLPFSMLMLKGGCTWAAGQGNSAIANSCS